MLNFSQIVGGGVTAAVAGLAIGLLGGAVDPQAQYLKTVKRADVEFGIAERRCRSAPEDQFHLCIALAFADKWRALADAEVKLHNTPDSRHAQRVVNAGGTLLIALQKCTTGAIWERPLCRDQAKETFRREVSRARVEQAQERSCTSQKCTRQPPVIKVRTTSV